MKEFFYLTLTLLLLLLPVNLRAEEDFVVSGKMYIADQTEVYGAEHIYYGQESPKPSKKSFKQKKTVKQTETSVQKQPAAPAKILLHLQFFPFDNAACFSTKIHITYIAPPSRTNRLKPDCITSADMLVADSIEDRSHLQILYRHIEKRLPRDYASNFGTHSPPLC